uniref:Uncharacterized protein n=1 Tax=Brassica oleracea TaxID=3712 RepID=A0A3P6H0T8_BRAOL|nr:unnamed protein product [Brassica oleracea]
MLSAVPHHTSGTIRSTYPEHRLVRSDYTAHQCRSGVVSFTTTANLCRSGRGGVSQSCSIAFSSVRSPDPLTTSASNLRLSPTIASFFAGFDNAVFASVIEPTLHQRQGLYGDKLFRVDLLSSPSTARTCPPHLHLLPHLGSETKNISSFLHCHVLSLQQVGGKIRSIVQGDSTVPKHSASYPTFAQTRSTKTSAMTICSGLFRL